jgi:hypothetical protein
MSINLDGRKILVHVASTEPLYVDFDYALLESLNTKAPAAPRPTATGVKK